MPKIPADFQRGIPAFAPRLPGPPGDGPPRMRKERRRGRAPGGAPGSEREAAATPDSEAGKSGSARNRKPVAGKALPFDHALLFYSFAKGAFPAGRTAGHTAGHTAGGPENAAAKMLARGQEFWTAFIPAKRENEYRKNDHVEVDESLVGSPGFKPVREALTLSWVGSIPTHLRHVFRPVLSAAPRCLPPLTQAYRRPETERPSYFSLA